MLYNIYISNAKKMRVSQVGEKSPKKLGQEGAWKDNKESELYPEWSKSRPIIFLSNTILRFPQKFHKKLKFLIKQRCENWHEKLCLLSWKKFHFVFEANCLVSHE